MWDENVAIKSKEYITFFVFKLFNNQIDFEAKPCFLY
jgi:hypothetical protein